MRKKNRAESSKFREQGDDKPLGVFRSERGVQPEEEQRAYRVV
jgi:hypothetical protein